MLAIEPIPAFNDNYIWLLRRSDSPEAVVVDPGDAVPVLEALARRDLRLTGILVTHHHPDHVGGLARLVAETAPTVYGPHNPAISGIDRRLGAGDRIELLGRSFEVMEVPGHTLDHIAYFSAGEPPLLFCGDTLFAGGCGRLFEGTAPMMHRSLQSLAALPPETRVYCAHEYTLANLAFARASTGRRRRRRCVPEGSPRCPPASPWNGPPTPSCAVTTPRWSPPCAARDACGVKPRKRCSRPCGAGRTVSSHPGNCLLRQNLLASSPGEATL